MSEPVQHTPGPWTTDGEGLGQTAVNADAGRSWKHICLIQANGLGSVAVSEDEAEANAEFIVRACNAHDDLLAAINGLLESCPYGESQRTERRNAAYAAIAKATKGV